MATCRYLVEQKNQGVSVLLLVDLDGGRRRELVEHLRTCASCRRAAVEEDPTLAFSLLEPEPIDRDRIGEIQASVRTLRRSRAIEKADRYGPKEAGKAVLVAASLLFALALLQLSGGRSDEEGADPKVGVAFEERSRHEWQEWDDDRSATPVLENLNRPEARVYQRTEEDLAVVMIVDETLDL
jgi:hypothetical protein